MMSTQTISSDVDIFGDI